MSNQHGKLSETWGLGGDSPLCSLGSYDLGKELFVYDEKITIFLRVTKINLQGMESAKIFGKEKVLKIWVHLKSEKMNK